MRSLALALVLLVAGCVAPSATEETAPLVEGPVPSFAQEHDHLDPALHGDASGLALLGAHTLAPDNGPRGDWMTTEIIVVGDFAYVTYMGAPWLLAIVDVRDASAPVLLSQWATANAWGADLAVSDDGDWVYIAVYPHAVGELFSPGYAIQHLGAPSGPSAPGVAVIDARDRSAPRLSSFLPIHGLGPHTVGYHRYEDGREIVFANKADLQFGNAIEIAEVVATPTGQILRPLSVWWLDAPVSPDQPHDADAELHPITGETLLYVAYTWAGLAIVDISDPAAPRTLARTAEGPDGADALLHDVHPYPDLVDGRHYTLAAPEIITGDTTGTLRVFDTTDPTAPSLVGTWRIPGDYVSDEPFGFTAHNFVYLPDGEVALGHGHAGVWTVDWLQDPAHPVATGYYARAFPDAAPPTWAPVHGTPWYWGTGVDARGVLWASDSMGGIVSLARSSDAAERTRTG